jgi:pimeloyl-ACP methyl ester carboxylesterase
MVESPDGTPIAWERAGSGPRVVLVDAAGSFRGFGPLAALPGHLTSRLEVITYDRRGRGGSGDTPPYAVEREIEDLGVVLDAAGGSASVFGFSSGGVLALHAAAAGLPITRLALLEPPILLDDEPPDLELERELAAMIAAGRRGDAVEHFHRSIGVPDEFLVGMRDAPTWSTWEAIAHTLVYDSIVTRTFSAARLQSIATPALVIDSDASDEYLHQRAVVTADRLPNGSHRTMAGEWHGVAAEDLAPVLVAFFANA